MEARPILDLLRERHSKDVFVDECKDGPTQSAEHRRLDAWAMKRSWSHPLVSGYEIKRSRSDFLRDVKWRDYLPMCNELYFVCPNGMIAPEEIPGDVGLMYVASTGTRLYTKRKAAYRDVQIPESVWRYILMCRARIQREIEYSATPQPEEWRAWLEDREEGRRVGYAVADKITKLSGERVSRIESRNRELENLFDFNEEPLKLIEEYGGRFAVRELLRRLKEKDANALPRGLLFDLKNVQRMITSLIAGNEPPS